MGVNCFRIEERPEVEVELIDLERGNSVKVRAIVDTGFAGWIIVPKYVYDQIASRELPKELWNSYATLNGQITMRTAKCILKIGNVSVEGFVETPIFGREFTLIGRQLLKRLKIEINKAQEICITDP